MTLVLVLSLTLVSGTDARASLQVSPQSIVFPVAGSGGCRDMGINQDFRIGRYRAGGFGGDGGPASLALLNDPEQVAPTPDGGFLIADGRNQRVRRVTRLGVITTFAGGGEGGDGGSATRAHLVMPTGVSVEPGGSVLIADFDGARVWRVRSDGMLMIAAGVGLHGESGDGGPATSARLASPVAVAAARDGGFFIEDNGTSGDFGDLKSPGRYLDAVSDRVRRVAADGTILTIAGGGMLAGRQADGHPATQAAFEGLGGIAALSDGGLLVADTRASLIWRVEPNGMIKRVAGNGRWGYSRDGIAATRAALHAPRKVIATGDGGFLFLDSNRNQVVIRRVSPRGVLTTLAGADAPRTDSASEQRGDGFSARQAFFLPYAIALTGDGGLLMSDVYAQLVRFIAPVHTDRLALALIRPQRRLRAGHSLALDYALTRAARVTIRVTRGKRTVVTHHLTAAAGRHTEQVPWQLPTGTYHLAVTARSQRHIAAACRQIVVAR